MTTQCWWRHCVLLSVYCRRIVGYYTSLLTVCRTTINCFAFCTRMAVIVVELRRVANPVCNPCRKHDCNCDFRRVYAIQCTLALIIGRRLAQVDQTSPPFHRWTLSSFYPVLQRAAMLSAVLATACLSVTRWYKYNVKTNQRRMMPSSLAGSPLTFNFGFVRFFEIFASDRP